jgi:hypothetical protein
MAAELPREFFKTLRTLAGLGAIVDRARHPEDESPAPTPYKPGATRGYPEASARLAALRDHTAARGAKFAVLLIPAREDLATPTATYLDMQRICSELSLDCLDPRAELKPSDYESPPKEHWNDSGHAKVAEFLAKRLDQSLPAP